ncbi:hypothetical protein E05_41010 [Plautia stali symbiont]|nr:hypothetical protein E05_41010 [Plautia stali symbiont]
MVLFHGLEGSFRSPYAHGLMQACQARGWLAVIMHFRGCSGEPNRLQRIYHSGETDDATYFLHWLQREWGTVPTAAVGVSLGGNMLACLLRLQGTSAPLDAAVAISAPLALEPCSPEAGRGLFTLLSALPVDPAEEKRHAQTSRLAGHAAGRSDAAARLPPAA